MKIRNICVLLGVVLGVLQPYNAKAVTWMIASDGSNLSGVMNDSGFPKDLLLQGSFNAGGTQYSIKGATTISRYQVDSTITNLRLSMYETVTQLSLTNFGVVSVNAPGNGGVIYMNNGSTASLSGMTFDNIAVTANGAVAALASSGGVLNVANSSFKNTNALTNAVSGGAFSIVSGNTLNITAGNTFNGLLASDSGGVISANGGQVNISGSNTFNNSRAVRGGAIYVSSGGMLSLNVANGESIVFSGNTATASGDTNAGGAILVDGANMSIKSDGAGSLVNFTGNSSPSMRGGAIYMVSGAGAYNTSFTASNGGQLRFENNSDAGWSNQYGSGALGVLGNYVTITADGGSVVFTGNKTTASGTLASGAIFIDSFRNGSGTSGATFKLITTNANSSIVFTNNTISGGKARDIAIYGGNFLVDGAGGYVFVGGGLSGTGSNISFTKSGNNTLIFGGDNSLYDCLYTQTGGAVKFNTSATMFATSIVNMKVSGGEQQIVLSDSSNANVSKSKGTFSSDGTLTYLASTTNSVVANFNNPSNVNFSDSTDVIFGADYDMATNVKVKANYVLNADSDFSKTNLGRVIFRDATLKLNQANYTKNYGLNNTTLDLRNGANASATFSNLTSVNSALAIDASITTSGLSADKLSVTTTTSGANTIALGNVSIANLTTDNGLTTSYSATILSGLTFSSVQNTQYMTSPLYRYVFGVNGANLTLKADSFTDGNSLNYANSLTSTRKFDFSVYGTSANQTYAIAGNLSNAGAGTFSVLGRTGYTDVINANGYSLFNLTNATTINFKDITLTGASGYDITLSNTGAIAYFDGTVNLNEGISGVSGTTAMVRGILNLNSNSNIGNGINLSVANGAVLNLRNVNTISLGSNQISGIGAVNNTGIGALNINGDNSGFTGIYTQSAGVANVSSAGKMFKGTNNINGGTLNVSGDSVYYKVNLATSAALNHYATTSANNNISNSVLSINGGTATFGVDGNVHGNYTLTSAISGSGSVNFSNSNVKLGVTNYAGSVSYGLNNSVLELTNSASFNTLNITNSSLSLDVSFASSSSITTNTLTVANAGQMIGLSSIRLLNDSLYDGLGKSYSFQTLKGLQWSDPAAVLEIATSSWQYEASVAQNTDGTLSDLVLTVVDASDEMTLDLMNKKTGSRGFNFSNVASETYKIGANLSLMETGDFIVQGNGSQNILSGNGYSLFDVENAVNFTLKNLTIRDAEKSGNGSVLYMNNVGAVARIESVDMIGNEAVDGGAIYVENGNAMIIDSTFSNNTASGKGGAINVAQNGILTMSANSKDIVFSGNKANGVDNDIYNDGNINISGGTGNHSVIVNGGISGNGVITKSDMGSLKINGDSSSYSGTFVQSGGNTIFTNKFFGGVSVINAGVLEYAQGGALSDTAVIQLGHEAGFLISSASDIALKSSQISGTGNITKSGNGEMTMSGDFSSFTGSFSQTAGNSVVGNSDKFFGGSKNEISNSSLQISSDSIYYKLLVSDNGQLIHQATAGDAIGINASDLKFGGANGSMTFATANYMLSGKLDNGKNNEVIFEDSNVSLGASDFTGSTAYVLDNSVLDLRNTATENITLTTIDFTNGSKLSLNLDLATANADTLSASNTTGGLIDVGQISLLSNDDDGNQISYSFNILSGLSFSGLTDTSSITTSAYTYDLSVSGTTITLTATGADDTTLYKQNAYTGNRSFDFHIYNANNVPDEVVVYNNATALGVTASGTLNIIGRLTDATVSVINGAVAGGGYGTLFDLENNTTLNITNLTMRNVVTPSSDGGVLHAESTMAVANLSNVIISDNEGGNGGAVYNLASTINITSGIFENNTAVADGGAVYNAGVLNLSAANGENITFTNNVANGLNNDIYNSGVVNINGIGTVDITGGITGNGLTVMNGNGILNLGGDNSLYSGKFRQVSGVTNVGGTFFAGSTELLGGIVNFNTGSLLAQTSEIKVEETAIVNVDDLNINEQFSGNGTINKTGDGILNIAGNNSEFNGSFNQMSGSVIATGVLFDTAMNIQGGTFHLMDGAEFAYNTRFNIANGAVLDIANTTISDVEMSSSCITVAGKVNKTGNGVLYLSGDFSSNQGVFTQSSGDTILADDTVLFGNSAAQNIIQGGNLYIHVDKSGEFNRPLTMDGGTLNYLSDTANMLNINNASLSDIVISNPDTRIVFDTASSTLSSEYNLAEDITAGGSTIVFNSSYVTIGANNFTGGTKYEFNNSILDLSTEIVANTVAPVQNIVFDNLTVNNTWLNVDVNFQLDDTEEQRTFVTADTVKNNGDAQQINLGTIKFHNGNADDGMTDLYTIKILDGNLTFENAQDVYYASGAHMYEVKTEIGGQSINLESKGQAGAHSLYTLNAQGGERIFSLDEYTDLNYVYHIDGTLSQTATGSITLIGNDAGTQTVSGAIVDGTGALTGDRGSLFVLNSDEPATLFAQNITLADAQSINGAMLVQDNIDGVVYFSNTTIKNNSVSNNGGAVYNANGTINIIDKGLITGNTAGASGGAIYNNATLNIVASSERNITFENNMASGASNDIYNSGTMNITGSGNVNINSGISGANNGIIDMSGPGTLNINADSSSYVGGFSQHDGTTNVTSAFFAGNNTIYGGVLNFNNGALQNAGSLNVNGGLVNLNGNAELSDVSVAIANGHLKFADSSQSNGANFAITSSGIMEVGAGSSINNGIVDVSGGHVSMGGVLNGAAVTVSGNGVMEVVKGGIFADGTLNIVGGGVSWSGTKQSNAVLTISEGILAIANNSVLELNNASDKIDLNSQIYVEAGSTLRNVSGNVIIALGDLINGTLQNEKTTTFNGVMNNYASGGKYQQTVAGAVTNIIGGAQIMMGANSVINNGTVNIGKDGSSDSILTVGTGSEFVKDVSLQLSANNHFAVNGGKAVLDNADSLNGTIGLVSGTMNFDNATLNGVLVTEGGNLNVTNGAIDLGSSSVIATNTNIMLSQNATMNINTGADVVMDNNDNIDGAIDLNGGKLLFNGFTNSKAINMEIASGTIVLENGTNWTPSAGLISNKFTNVEINNSTLNIPEESLFNTFGTVSMNNGTFNTMNNAAELYIIDTLEMNGSVANFAIDIEGEHSSYDTFNINKLVDKGSLNISNVRILSAPVEQTLVLDVFHVNTLSLTRSITPLDGMSFTTTVDNVSTGIYNYSFTSNNDGTYTLSRSGTERADFAMEVFRGQRAAVAVMSHEMSITNMAFDHIYLDTRGCEMCVYSDGEDDNKGFWAKSYYISETLNGNNNVGDLKSDFSGVVAGFDFPTYKVSDDLDFMPTLYFAYNRSDLDEIEQTGMRVGLMGTFTSGAASATVMGYAGNHESDMIVGDIIDSSSINFFGGAVKGAYDFKTNRNFIIQPNITAGYRVFSSQSWTTNLGNIAMETDVFDGLNAAPGLNVIYPMDTLSAYVMSRYMMQVSGCDVGAQAGNVDLPEASACKNYAEFGIGASTAINDSFSGYVQATSVMGGRSGVGGKLGLNIKF